ncbi:hypothetical protein C0Q70_17624 [Pomacea canaliculata]|uniref:Uncharacterized protein n=1 Tax=Pomacea canaliculata TaxID=400727 RepID=A0A2T7NKY2_POMCA|nr:hypothetical protein C0Q70_17624 [Pomacea canaliculata]
MLSANRYLTELIFYLGDLLAYLTQLVLFMISIALSRTLRLLGFLAPPPLQPAPPRVCSPSPELSVAPQSRNLTLLLALLLTLSATVTSPLPREQGWPDARALRSGTRWFESTPADVPGPVIVTPALSSSAVKSPRGPNCAVRPKSPAMAAGSPWDTGFPPLPQLLLQ